MSEQSAKSHAALDPLTHFTLTPIYLVTLGVAIYIAVHFGPEHLFLRIWLVVVALSFILLNMKTRLYTLKLQDRVIRLEERLRLAGHLTPAELDRLTTQQMIALRFAPDVEVAGLARRAGAETLGPKEIKAAIGTWRADHARV